MTPDRVLRPRIVGFTPGEISALVNLRVVEEHASEAAFLWKRREQGAQAPHYKLKHLAKLDARLLAHLRGLQVAGDAGWRAAARLLGEADAGAIFVAAYLACASLDVKRMRHVLQLALAEKEFDIALRAALAWFDEAEVRPVLDRLAGSSNVWRRTIALAVRSARRIAVSLADAVKEPNPALRARALRSIGETGQSDCRAIVEDALHDADARCRFWAGWSLALLGGPSGARVAFEAAAESPDLEGCALQVAMRCGEEAWARETVRSLAATPDKRRQAIQAAAAYGDAAAMPWLIDHLDDAQHARVAGEAISMLTGADLDYLDLDRDPPDGAGEALPEDEDLPWPDGPVLRSWWAQQRARFVAGRRYLLGEVIGADAALKVLREGYQRQRLAAAIEFARCRPGTMLFPVRARADWQQRRLAA